MSARIIYDYVDPALLTRYIREFDNEVLRNERLLETWLPAVENQTLEWKAPRNSRKDVDVALYRAFDTPPRMTGRQGVASIRGELMPLSRQIPLGEEEMLRLRALLQGGGLTGPNGDFVRAIFNDAELMIRAVQMRLELARGQVLTTGKFTLAENGLFLEADFGMKSSHKPVAAASWALAATDILSDLLAWTQLYVDDNGFMPATFLTARKVLGYMYNNTSLKNAAGFGGSVPARLNNEMIDAVLAANGLPPITLYDTTARVEGVQTRIIPDDKFLLMPPTDEPLGETQYGVTAEAIKLAEKGLIVASEMPGIVAVGLENENPVQTFTLGTAIAVPVLPNPDLVIAADVVP